MTRLSRPDRTLAALHRPTVPYYNSPNFDCLDMPCRDESRQGIKESFNVEQSVTAVFLSPPFAYSHGETSGHEKINDLLIG